MQNVLQTSISIKLLVYLLFRLKQILETNILFGGIQLLLHGLYCITHKQLGSFLVKSQECYLKIKRWFTFPQLAAMWLVMNCITGLVTLVMDGEISWNSFRFFTLLQESDIHRNLIYIGLDWIGSFSGNVTMKNLILISVTSILIIDINVQEHRIKNVLTKPSRYI